MWIPIFKATSPWYIDACILQWQKLSGPIIVNHRNVTVILQLLPVNVLRVFLCSLNLSFLHPLSSPLFLSSPVALPSTFLPLLPPPLPSFSLASLQLLYSFLPSLTPSILLPPHRFIPCLFYFSPLALSFTPGGLSDYLGHLQIKSSPDRLILSAHKERWRRLPNQPIKRQISAENVLLVDARGVLD